MRPLLQALLVLALATLGASRAAAQQPPPPASLSQGDMQKLLDALDAEKPLKVRLQAALILGRTGGSSAVPALISCLERDPDYPVRAACALALGNVGSVRAVEPLVTAMDDAEGFVRDEAQKALKKLARVEALPYLEAARETGSVRVRLALADIASGMRPTDAGTLIAELLGDPEDRVRASAEASLDGLDAASASTVLLKGLEHPNFRVKTRCAFHLGKRREVKAVDRLAELAVSPLEAAEVQDAARLALRQMKEALPGAALAATARDASKDKRDRVRGLVLLSAKGGPDALQACLDVLVDPEESMRGSAAQALADLGDPRALPPLREAMGRDDNQRISKVIAVSIRKLERGGLSAANP